MSKLDTAAPTVEQTKSIISDRTAMAAQLVKKHDTVTKEIIDFMQADPQVKQSGWQGSPYSYLQYVLAKWAVDRLN